jgi:hypothetical protein
MTLSANFPTNHRMIGIMQRERPLPMINANLRGQTYVMTSSKVRAQDRIVNSHMQQQCDHPQQPLTKSARTTRGNFHALLPRVLFFISLVLQSFQGHLLVISMSSQITIISRHSLMNFMSTTLFSRCSTLDASCLLSPTIAFYSVTKSHARLSPLLLTTPLYELHQREHCMVISKITREMTFRFHSHAATLRTSEARSSILRT